MRYLLAAPLVLALLVIPVAGQMEFGQSYQVRAGFGDIPSTVAVERASTWNVEQRLTVPLNGTTRALHFQLPAGSGLETVACSCASFTRQVQAGAVTVTLAANNTDATATVTVLSSQAFSTVVAFSVRAPPEAGQDAVVILYVPAGMDLSASGTPTSPGQSTDGTSTIQWFSFNAATPLPDPFWAALHPTVATAPPPGPAPVASASFPWLMLALAFGAGIVAWALLVQAGAVQARSRKQVAQVAAHEEIAAHDPPAVLEGKKRALLAALKEVEMAKQAQELDTPTYDAVKAEFKRQAVTVMRALEMESDDKNSK